MLLVKSGASVSQGFPLDLQSEPKRALDVSCCFFVFIVNQNFRILRHFAIHSTRLEISFSCAVHVSNIKHDSATQNKSRG